MKGVLQLGGAIALCQIVGVFGALFTASAIPEWYEGLAKPMLTPPAWVFGPVWVTLYTLMGVAAYIVWRQRTEEECHCGALQLFLFQLGLNAVWSYLFFGLREPLLALFEIVALLLTILVVIWQFWGISKIAAYLMVPYAVWVGFATYLNYAIWQLN